MLPWQTPSYQPDSSSNATFSESFPYSRGKAIPTVLFHFLIRKCHEGRDWPGLFPARSQHLEHSCCSVTTQCLTLLRLHELQHARLPCPLLSPRVCSNSCPLSHPTISSCATPVSSCSQSFPISGSFPMSQLFTSGDQSIGPSASVLPMNIRGRT